MPSAAAMARSSGVVMKPRTRSAFAPTYAVRTVTVALSRRGYWRTLSVRIAWMPAMMMTRLTTSARTGRRTKTSVSFTGLSSVVLGVRRDLGLGLHRVVDGDGRAVAQLEGAGGHDLLPGLDAVDDGDEVAARLARLHELLAGHLGLGAGGGLEQVPRLVLAVLDDEERVSVRGVHQRVRRHEDDVVLVRQDDRDLREHARQELLVAVREARAQLDGARRRVDGRIDRAHRAVGGRDALAFDHDAHRHPERHRLELLLRQGEIDVHAVRRLEHRDGRAGVEVLAQVHLPDAELPGERRAHHLARDLRAEQAEVRVRRLDDRVVVVLLRRRQRLRRHERARAARVHLGELAAGLGRFELRALDVAVELDQDLPLVDHLARLEVDGRNDAGGVVAHGHPARRRHAPHRVQRFLPGVVLDDRRADRLGRGPGLLHRVAHGDEPRDLLEFHGREPPDDEDDGQDGDDDTHGGGVPPYSPPAACTDDRGGGGVSRLLNERGPPFGDPLGWRTLEPVSRSSGRRAPPSPHAERPLLAGGRPVEGRDRVAAPLLVDLEAAALELFAVDAVRAVVRVEIVADAPAHRVHADVARRVALAAADVVARLLAVAARRGELLDDG